MCSREAVLEYSAEFGLDDDAEGSIAINMLPLLAKQKLAKPGDKSTKYAIIAIYMPWS